MRIFYIGILLLPLAACEQLQQADASAKKFLSQLEGSKKSASANPSPQADDAQLSLADSYRQNGNEDQAIAIYDALIAQNATPTEAKEGKALALLAKGDFDAPPALLEEVMAADPRRWKTLNALGVLFTTRNMHAEAQQYFQEALKFSPANPAVLSNIGLSQALTRNYTAAFQNLILASGYASERERQRIDLNLALAYATSGRLSDARAIASRYYSGSQLYNNLGLYARLAKDDRLARDYLNMALTENKTFYEKPWVNLQAIGSDGTEPMTPAPAAALKAEKKSKPAKAKPKPKAKPKAKPRPKPQPKPEVKPEPVSVPEPKPEPVAEPKAAPEPAPAPEVKPEAKPEPAPAPKPEAPAEQPKAQPAPPAPPPPPPKAEPAPEPKPEAKPKKSKSDERLSDIINADD